MITLRSIRQGGETVKTAGKFYVKLINLESKKDRNVTWTKGDKTSKELQAWISSLFFENPAFFEKPSQAGNHNFFITQPGFVCPKIHLYTDQGMNNELQGNSHLREGQPLFVRPIDWGPGWNSYASEKLKSVKDGPPMARHGKPMAETAKTVNVVGDKPEDGI